MLQRLPRFPRGEPLRGVQVALRLGQPGAGLGADHTAPRPDEVRRGGDLRSSRPQILFEAPAGALRLLLRLTGPIAQRVESCVRFHDPGETAQRVGVHVRPGVVEGRLRGLAGLGEFRTTRGGELFGVGDALCGVGHRGRQRRDRPPDVVGGVVDCVEHRGSVPESTLRFADGSHGVALLADGTCHRGAALIDGLLGELDLVLRQRHVVRDRGERAGRELRSQLGQRRLGLGQPRAQRDRALCERVEAGGCVEQEVAHPVERLDLRVEFPVGLAARRDQLHEHVALLLGRLGDGVVEPLPDLECGRQSRLRLSIGAVERLDRGIAELSARQLERLGARANGVVRLDQDLLGVQLEALERQLAQRVGVGRVGGRRRLGARLGPLALRAPGVQVHPPGPGRDHSAADEQRGAGAGTRRRQRRVETLGRRHRGPGPVLAAQLRHDPVRADGVPFGRGDPGQGVRRPQRVLAVLRGHGEQGRVRPEVAGLRSPLGPVVGRQSGERRHVRHPQLHPVLGVERVCCLLDLRRRCRIQYSGGVGDRLGKPEGRLGRRRTGQHQPGQGREQDRHRHRQRAAERAGRKRPDGDRIR
ncbi:hypothetical protein EBESD8_60020 [Rhodococcus aetherivorans]|nr:hypothetical protein EBESD8_60020 [Rhodococcus aetherivorans]